MDIYWLGIQILRICQQMSPFDTGNLAFNAIKLQILPNEIIITFEENLAPYIDFLEEGTVFTDIHKDFIKRDIVFAITQFVKDVYSGLRGTMTIDIETLSKKAQNNPARNELFLRSIAEGVG